jgi:2-polyprenyl-3-methyl-5-hydroxy-6-metoxy-1,4-benzoquinol methylase
MMTFNESIRVEEMQHCFLCLEVGKPIYEVLSDFRNNVERAWNFLRCPECGLVWLNPYPLPEEFEKVYTADYCTHREDEDISKLSTLRKEINIALRARALGCRGIVDGWTYSLGGLLSLFPPLKEIGSVGTMCLGRANKGKLLDIGCGKGGFLAMMRDAYWDVLGVEPDRVPRRIAQQLFGVPVVRETTGLADECFDAVTMSHVIEHVPNPIELLKECSRLLKPGGKLVIITPNIESLGRLIFQSSWALLDPPRHVFLFSLSTLETCVQKAGFRVEVLRTTAWYSRGTWLDSFMIRRKRKMRNDQLTWLLKIQGWIYQVLQDGLRRLWRKAGEELLLVATKPYNKAK